ncbi:MAG: hypothetical protein IPL22_09310 [Bacteroidetes bacterium]|nr:hypothetical protein [Bacteroidota bacterium]
MQKSLINRLSDHRQTEGGLFPFFSKTVVKAEKQVNIEIEYKVTIKRSRNFHSIFRQAMSRRCGKFLLLLWLLLLTIPAIPQSKKELERKTAAAKEIDQTNKELNATAKSKKLTASQVDALKKKIKLRQQLIGTINSELDGLSSQITTTSGEITSWNIRWNNCEMNMPTWYDSRKEIREATKG